MVFCPEPYLLADMPIGRLAGETIKQRLTV
jgi:hypothetical protein